ncbi:sensor histidine kinase RegB [Meridianimarinicoccus aquatilis]|uniref:histidine kinase n=1 Tax=Meridianimarinicoccus aquatilis TaxID=2552766 RepID=A0A4R6B3A2_9RHOB|nr:ActS/PrrB/RegB family redox-sensitive histidine kinase [Fluviibacterium aquatile]QIE40778.1 ActS/PrrB/RegB family redox-sensitive histidine kinase [Rhodobacteraceae bacterium SC52]TDL89093.1 ActS/PrrB/RegB family redox-sensitive histidine kinase [Fluviibacterium aquatile]
MADTNIDMFKTGSRSHWIRLRTLIVLRWIAICGQLVTITVAQVVFSLNLPLAFCYLAVSASVVSNLIAIYAFPENKRLTEAEVVSMLLFDIAQLCFLLYLSGGLNNPFALLVLAPVTISASVLRLKSTMLLGGTAFVLLTAVAFFHVPLRTHEGFIMQMPHDFMIGFWIAIVIGLGFIAGYARRISIEIHSMSDALLATQMALVREQKLTDLGGVVAAAAHELGTPLATIKLVSSELASELEDPDHKEDACLIRDQADRCRDILRSMGRAGKDDKHMQNAPLDTLIREAAEPHSLRGIKIHYVVAPEVDGETEQPFVKRQPEIIHGVRNFVQNAVDFAVENVWIDASWTDSAILITISDDGPGYPPQVIGRLGDPFLRHRKTAEETAQRPEYEGMGLGLFIAKTLLERSGASVQFSNGSDPFLTLEERPPRSGAVVKVRWPRDRIATSRDAKLGALGLNERIET